MLLALPAWDSLYATLDRPVPAGNEGESHVRRLLLRRRDPRSPRSRARWRTHEGRRPHRPRWWRFAPQALLPRVVSEARRGHELVMRVGGADVDCPIGPIVD